MRIDWFLSALQHAAKAQPLSAPCPYPNFSFLQVLKINEVVLCLGYIYYSLLISRNKRALSPAPPFSVGLQLLSSSPLSCSVRRAPLSCYYNATHILASSPVNLTGMLSTKPCFITQLLALFKCISGCLSLHLPSILRIFCSSGAVLFNFKLT